MANEKVTQLPTVSTANLTDVIYAVQAGVSVKETLQQVKDLLSGAVITSYPGNPNSNVAGDLNSLVWDTTNLLMWICTTSGSILTSVWTPIYGNMTNGQLIVGSTANPPVRATINAGTNIGVTNSAGSITIDAANVLPLAGGTMTGDINMNGHNITNLLNLSAMTGFIAAPTRIQDASGNILLNFSYTASAVNYINTINAATGNSPTLASTGSDAAVPLTFATKNSNIFFKDTTNTIAPATRWYNSASTHYSALKAPSASSTDVTFNLPAADAAGFMVSDGSTNLSLANTTTDITGSISITGFSLLTTAVFTATRIGKFAFYSFNLAGTSNSTAFTISSLPYTTGVANMIFAVWIQNAGVAGNGYVQLNGTGLTFFISPSSSTWTNSGTKQAAGSFWFLTT